MLPLHVFMITWQRAVTAANGSSSINQMRHWLLRSDPFRQVQAGCLPACEPVTVSLCARECERGIHAMLISKCDRRGQRPAYLEPLISYYVGGMSCSTRPPRPTRAHTHHGARGALRLVNGLTRRDEPFHYTLMTVDTGYRGLITRLDLHRFR